MALIALVGMCGSGKSVAAGYLEDNGYTGVHFGSLTMETMKERGMEITPDNERQVREELRRDHGMAAFAVLSIKKIKDLLKKSDKVYIDGLYSWDEYKVLHNEFGNNLSIVNIFVDKEIRYQRLSRRKFRPLTPEEAMERDIKEIENIAKGGPISFSDKTIINNGSEADFIEELKSSLKNLI